MFDMNASLVILHLTLKEKKRERQGIVKKHFPKRQTEKPAARNGEEKGKAAKHERK